MRCIYSWWTKRAGSYLIAELRREHMNETERMGALAAMKRARLRAEELARATGTHLVEVHDGKVVFVQPPPSAAEPVEEAPSQAARER